MDKLRKMIVISGMTGVGKTNIAKILAQHINGEIVCADAQQIYKGLDILTNKPWSGVDNLQNSSRSLLSDTKISSNLNTSQSQHHMIGKYDPMDPITSTLYAHDARKVIKEILARGKIPIVEGGSPFYISQIFNPQLSFYHEEKFLEAKQVAQKIIKVDGFNFEKTFARYQEICQKVHIPDTEKISLNDFYRLEQKTAFALYLQFKNETYASYMEKASQNEENQFFSQINKRCFYLFGNKNNINKVLDMRVEDMVSNSGFFKEVIDFAEIIVQRNDPYLNKINPFYRSIGFLETMKFMNDFYLYNDYISLDFKKKYAIKQEYQKIVHKYLEDFKAKNRQFAKRQNIWYRKEQDYLWIDVMSEGKIHNIINRMINHLQKDDIKPTLDSDEQAKIRAVNTGPDLRTYQSEGRLLTDNALLNTFMYNALNVVVNNKNTIKNPIFSQKNKDVQQPITAQTSQTAQPEQPSQQIEAKENIRTQSKSNANISLQ